MAGEIEGRVPGHVQPLGLLNEIRQSCHATGEKGWLGRLKRPSANSKEQTVTTQINRDDPIMANFRSGTWVAGCILGFFPQRKSDYVICRRAKGNWQTLLAPLASEPK